jgi:hypothetical protein
MNFALFLRYAILAALFIEPAFATETSSISRCLPLLHSKASAVHVDSVEILSSQILVHTIGNLQIRHLALQFSVAATGLVTEEVSHFEVVHQQSRIIGSKNPMELFIKGVAKSNPGISLIMQVPMGNVAFRFETRIDERIIDEKFPDLEWPLPANLMVSVPEFWNFQGREANNWLLYRLDVTRPTSPLFTFVRRFAITEGHLLETGTGPAK